MSRTNTNDVYYTRAAVRSDEKPYVQDDDTVSEPI